VPPWLKEAGLCEALTEPRRTPIQIQSATYAAVRSGQGMLLRITADTASCPVCGAPHTAEFEADLIRMRTREGMAIARAKGKLRGKQPKLSTRQQRELRRMHDVGTYSISDLAELFSVSRPTVYRTLARHPTAT
jgi:hypothetical protein